MFGRKPKAKHSVFDEPHLRGKAQIDPSEARAAKKLDREAQHAAAHPSAETPRDSVYDEPDFLPDRPSELIDQDWTCSRCGYNLRGLMTGHPCPECRHIELYRPPPTDRPTYSTWLSKRAATVSEASGWRTAFLVALAGGPWAVLGAFLSANGWGMAATPLMGLIFFGPLSEEVMKIGLTATVVELAPYRFRLADQIRFAAIGSALVFAIIENILYLTVYIPNPTPFVVIFRWTVCVALHVGCTALAVSGLVPVWSRAMSEGRKPRLTKFIPGLLLAHMLHGAYNFAMFLWTRV